MTVQSAVSIIIGAEIGSSYRSVLGTAQKQINTLGAAIKGLNSASSQINSFQKLQKETLKVGQEWRNAENEAKRLSQEISQTDKPSKDLLANFKKIQKEAKLARQAFLNNKKALADMSEAMQTAGINTNNLSQEQTRLGRAISILENRHRSLANIQAAKAQNMANRAAYRSQIMDVRTPAEQEKCYKTGKSKLKYGHHNNFPATAIDVSPWPIPREWGAKDWKERAKFYYFAGFVKATAQSMNIKLRWGGDWNDNKDFSDQTFDDLVHFELV